jgi:hypothetical protein
MKRSFRRLTIGVGIAGVGLLLNASAAWACLSVAGITASPTAVQPGGSVTVNGIGFEFGTNPIVIHLDTLDGNVLGTATLDRIGDFSQAVTLPAGVSNGPHILIATQAAATPDGKNNGSNTGVPARAVIQVGNAVAPTASPARPVAVIANSGIGIGTLIVISIVVAAVGLILAGSWSLVASRRWRRKAEYVKTS